MHSDLIYIYRKLLKAGSLKTERIGDWHSSLKKGDRLFVKNKFNNLEPGLFEAVSEVRGKTKDRVEVRNLETGKVSTLVWYPFLEVIKLV